MGSPLSKFMIAALCIVNPMIVFAAEDGKQVRRLPFPFLNEEEDKEMERRRLFLDTLKNKIASAIFKHQAKSVAAKYGVPAGAASMLTSMSSGGGSDNSGAVSSGAPTPPRSTVQKVKDAAFQKNTGEAAAGGALLAAVGSVGFDAYKNGGFSGLDAKHETGKALKYGALGGLAGAGLATAFNFHQGKRRLAASEIDHAAHKLYKDVKNEFFM